MHARSAEAAKEIKTLIASSGEQVGRGVQLVGATGEALSELVGARTRRPRRGKMHMLQQRLRATG